MFKCAANCQVLICILQTSPVKKAKVANELQRIGASDWVLLTIFFFWGSTIFLTFPRWKKDRLEKLIAGNRRDDHHCGQESGRENKLLGIQGVLFRLQPLSSPYGIINILMQVMLGAIPLLIPDPPPSGPKTVKPKEWFLSSGPEAPKLKE